MTRTSKSLWFLFAAPVIWALHFLASYVATAIFCEKPALFGGSFASLRLAIAGLTAFSLAAILLVAILSWHQWGFGRDRPPHDDPTDNDRTLFQGYSTLLLSALSFVAVLFTSLPVVFLATCLR